MVKLANLLSRLHSIKALVIGDMLLDSYTIGKARRISPEAPVAVVNVLREEHRPGGAGNVILNLLSLGASVVAIGRVGRDWAGKALIDALNHENVDVRMIICEEKYSTPIKNRIIADNQQIVRIDHEKVAPLQESLEQFFIENLDEALKEIQVVAISDYGKGLLTPTLLAALIEKANKKGIPIITDPKGHDFQKYRGTTIIKPNLSETYAAANLPSTASLDQVASVVLNQSNAKLLMVTRSEAGISLFHHKEGRSDYPVQAKEVKDVTGAGDTVLAMLAYSIANGLAYDEAAQLCNVSASIAIEHVGCARVSLSDLALRLFQQNITHKIFDQEHLFVLQQLLKGSPYTLATLSNFSELTPLLYQALKEISSEEKSLLIYVEDHVVSPLLLEMLSSLQEVDFIILHSESVKSLCQQVAPQSTYQIDAAVKN